MPDFVPTRLFDASRGIYLAPVRHHSPACGHYVAALIREIRPRRVLIECPVDFEPLIPLLLDEETRPPVAIVAFPQKGPQANDFSASYYPFSTHAPEFVALKEGAAVGAEIRFIDLASNHRAMLAADADGMPRSSAFPLIGETVFDSSRYVHELCARSGCRDRDELWDHLFEQMLGRGGWREFFTAVGAYCAHVRATTSERVMERDGTLQRELHMAECVKSAVDGRPILVLTGGFHSPAPVAPPHGEALPRPAADANGSAPSPSNAYVIRYGFEQLEMLNGYAAGLPSPAYYARLWEARSVDAATTAIDWRALAAETITGFAAHLRAHRPALAPPT